MRVHRTARFTLATFSALAFLTCAPTAVAQNDVNRDLRNAETAQAPRPRPRPNRDAATLTDEVRTPRYRVEQVSFYADDESGVWDTGSDEIISNVFTSGYMLKSHEFSDVDTGENRTFADYERCILPAYDPDGGRNGHWACRPEGVAGPIAFTIGLRESDTELIPSGTCLYSATDMLGDRCDLRNGANNDLGVYSVQMSEAELVAAMPTVGATFERRLPIGGGYIRRWEGTLGGERGDTDDAGYEITIRFTRVADEVRLVPRSRTTH